MVRRPMAGVLALAIAVALLAGCIDTDPPGEKPNGRSGGHRSPEPGPDSDLVLTGSAFRVGPPEIVVGPVKYVDSYFTAIKVGTTVRGYVGNRNTMLLEGTTVADLVPTEDRVIGAANDPTRWDDCGAWLEGVEADDEDPQLLHAWYHAEWQCNYAIDQTDKSIAYAESRDGGRTFVKVDYPNNQVVSSPLPFVEDQRNGRGDLTVIRRGDRFYMYYLNVLADEETVTSVARAPVASGGVPGTWHNYTVDEDGRGTWTEDAREGSAAALETSPPVSSASVHLPSGEVLLARQHPRSGGIVLQASADGIHFTKLSEPIVPILKSQAREEWGTSNEGQIIGYVSIVGPDGSRNWSDEFYLFHMYVFPGDELSANRYLVRRHVVVDDAPDEGPWSTVALASYAGPGGDRFATSAPERDGRSDGIVGYLLGSHVTGRRALVECTSTTGDRFVAADCGGDVPEDGRLVGYAYTVEQSGTVGLYWCETSNGDQFTSLDQACEGGQTVAQLGFVYPPPA